MCVDISSYATNTVNPASPCEPYPITVKTHKMVTRTQMGSLKPKVLFSMSAVTTCSPEPTCYSQAAKDKYWCQAIYIALINNGTWKMVRLLLRKMSSVVSG